MRRALIVEDDPDIVELVTHYLARDGFQVEAVGDGRAALAQLRRAEPDLLILDLQLPGLDGLAICREIRSQPRTRDLPVIMLTARGDEADRIVGLELGADDYVVKPFSPRELVARIRAILRRVDRQAEPSDRIEVGGVSIDISRMRVEASGRNVELTPTEFQLLVALARQPGRIFTRSQLLDAIHGVAFESYERAIDAHVKNLRRKLEDDPGRPRYVLTVYGVGYRFAEEQE
jgi:DNA-binding response OmpR family regulator